MSLSTTRTYFRTRLTSLGYKEWADGFNYQNIPENILHQAFHIENFESDVVKTDPTGLELNTVVVTRVFFKGFRTVKEALDSTDAKLEAIIADVMKPSNRLSGADGLRNVLLESVVKLPISISNDNTILAELKWIAQVNICIE